MTTTSVKLPEELKQRASQAAKSQGISTHAFLLDAIRQVTDAAERHRELVRAAAEARGEARSSGDGFAADEVHEYFRNKVHAQPATRPVLRKWRK